MVHSKGTREELQRFKIDRTGSRKYSGRSSDFRLLSAGGEMDARRAMPTSGAAAVAARFRKAPLETGATAKPASPVVSGGQPASEPCELLLGLASGASSRVIAFGPTASGQSGKSCAAGCGTGRRRIR